MTIVILAIGIILIALNIKHIKSDEKVSFSSVLEEKEEGATDLKVEIGKVRKNMGESLTDLQLEIDELRDEIAYLKFTINEMKKSEKEGFHNKSIEENHEIYYNKLENINKNVKEKDVINNINFGHKNEKFDKKQKIEELIQSGLTDGEICEKLNVGKGEVLLIRGLFKN